MNANPKVISQQLSWNPRPIVILHWQAIHASRAGWCYITLQPPILVITCVVVIISVVAITSIVVITFLNEDESSVRHQD
jgi:hypothetical protein